MLVDWLGNREFDWKVSGARLNVIVSFSKNPTFANCCGHVKPTKFINNLRLKNCHLNYRKTTVMTNITLTGKWLKVINLEFGSKFDWLWYLIAKFKIHFDFPCSSDVWPCKQQVLGNVLKIPNVLITKTLISNSFKSVTIARATLFTCLQLVLFPRNTYRIMAR